MLEHCTLPSMLTGSARFEECLDIVLHEGGSRAESSNGASHDVDTMSDITRTAYLEGYWIPAHAGKCPSPLDLVVFDCAVRSGVLRSILTLQEALGCIDRDGTFGHRTWGALGNCDGFAVAIKFLELRRAFYQDAVFRTFCKGKEAAAKLSHIDWLLDAIGAIA